MQWEVEGREKETGEENPVLHSALGVRDEREGVPSFGDGITWQRWDEG